MEITGQIFNYSQYMSRLELLVEEGRTSGNNQNKNLIEFTALNLTRMNRLNKTIQLTDDLENAVSNISEKQHWVLIAEFWCGDCAQNLPLIGKMAAISNGKIELKIIQRDENPIWLEKYHTNGARSIPKLIAFDKDGNELFKWGPRPQGAQLILEDWKSNSSSKNWDDFEKELHTWYAKDKSTSIQNEFYNIFNQVQIKM